MDMDDYGYDDGDDMGFEDAFIWVDDEFNIADELAETQVASPGYMGTNHEVYMETWDYDFFEYWDDMEYAEDPYWDYEAPGKDGQRKRKRAETDTPNKKRKMQELDDSRQVVWMSREERNKLLFAKAPPLEDKRKKVALLPDWRKRFAAEDGVLEERKMPAAMKKAAEAVDEESPLKNNKHTEIMENGEDEEEGDWEDDEGAEEGGALSADMLQTVLREQLGAAGLGGADEADFMRAIQQMMSGEGEGDAAGDLANALLSKLLSQGGNEALSGWLSQQGVALEDDDEASSVATEELPEGPRPSAASRRNLHQSPPDSAIGMADVNSSGRKTTQMPLHSGSPTSSSKKRNAAVDDAKPAKKVKKVQFDVPPSTSSDAIQGASNLDDLDNLASDDPLMSEATIGDAAANAKKAPASTKKETKSNAKNSRKRKASSPDADGDGEEEKKSAAPPAKKKTRSRELQALGSDVPDVASPAPPARRTRSKAHQAK